MQNAKKERIRKHRLKEADFPCASKIKFKLKKEAIESRIKESFKRNIELFIYKCKFCRYWHLTSSKSR